ncbi:MAG: hypothetical protein RIR11_3359 [Bacteroidota bacterium]|jgi:RND family efflux transporter MFP subunit
MKNILLAVTVIAVLLFSACQSEPQIPVSESAKFLVISPIQTDTFYNSEYVAEIQSRQNVEIRARVRSFITKIHVDEGKFVKQGQLLFTLGAQGFREELSKAQAVMKSATAEQKPLEIEIKNTQILVEKGVISKTELDMKIAQLDVLKAKIEEAKVDISAAETNLSFTEIRAPFDGIVGRIPNKAGSLIEEGAMLTTLSDNEAVFAYFNVSEKEYLSLTREKDFPQKSNLTLLLADGSPHNYTGVIETIDGQFDPNTGNIALRARFPNPQQLLRHGASGKVLLKNELKNALIVPQKSTFDVQDKTYVFTVDKDGIVSRRSIVLKLRLPHLFIVESGVTTLDRILFEGIQNVKEGDKIEVEDKLNIVF